MRHDEIPDNLRSLVYDFFFWFSRFEYALKEARVLKNTKPGANAEPDWTRFINERKDSYQIGATGKALITANPQRQIVTADQFGRDGFCSKPCFDDGLPF